MHVWKPCAGAAKIVAMAGDGINDAPGAGHRGCGASPWARARMSPMESAGVTLVKGDLRGPRASDPSQPRRHA